MITTARTTCVVALLLVACGCGQDLELGSLQQQAEGARLPPPPSASAGGCRLEDPALLRPPAHCYPGLGPSTVTEEGRTFLFPHTVERCVVTADGQVHPMRASPNFAACPLGVYLALNETPPPADALARQVLVYRGDENAWSSPPDHEQMSRSIELVPDRNGIFVKLDPRGGKGGYVWVVLTYPEGVPGRKNPFWLFNRLPIDEAAAPVVESRREP